MDVGVQYGPVIGGAIALSGGAWAIIKILFARIEASHAAQVEQLLNAVGREQARAEKAEARADQYESELKASVKGWFEQVAPAMGAAAHAIDAVTTQLIRRER